MTINVEKEKSNKIRDYKTKVEAINSLLHKHVENLQKERVKALDTYNRTLDHSKTKVLSKFRDLKKIIDQLTTDLEEYKNKSLDADKDAIFDRLEGLLGEITSGIDNLKNNLIRISTEQEEDISLIYSRMGDHVSSGLTDIYKDQRDQIDQIEESISLTLEEIKDEMMTIVRKEDSNHQEYIDKTSSSILDVLTTIHQRVKELVEVKEKEINSLILDALAQSDTSLETAKQYLSVNLEGASKNLDEILKQQNLGNANLQDTLNKDIIKSQSEVNKRIEKLHTETLEEWKLKKNEELKALEAIQKSILQQYEKNLTVNESFQNKLLLDLDHQVKSNLYNEIDNISLGFTQFQDLFVDKIDALITRLTNFRDEIKQNLDFLLVSNLKKIGEISQQTEEQLSQLFSVVSNEYEKSREVTKTDLSNSVKEHLGAITDYVTNFDNNLDEKLGKVTDDLNNSLKDFHESTEGNVKESISKNNETLTQFKTNTNEVFNNLQHDQNTNIEQTLKNLQNILQSRQKDLIASLNSMNTETEERLSPQRLTIKEKSTELVQTGNSGMKKLNDELNTFQKEKTAKVKKIIDKTHQELDQFVKSSESKVQQLVEGLENNHKSLITEFKSNADNDISENQQLLNEFISSLEEKFTKFFEQQHQNLDQFIGKSRSQKGVIDGVRNSLDKSIEEVSSHIDSETENLQNNFSVNIQSVLTSTNSVIESLDELVKQLNSIQ